MFVNCVVFSKEPTFEFIFSIVFLFSSSLISSLLPLVFLAYLSGHRTSALWMSWGERNEIPVFSVCQTLGGTCPMSRKWVGDGSPVLLAASVWSGISITEFPSHIYMGFGAGLSCSDATESHCSYWVLVGFLE